ncbi:MAG: RluA family pseudouridine synthase [Clostridia bacterium]|nr:RluA family pseudouridine synthase [Clostridia bacterium]
MDILYQDKNLIFVVKPSGVLSQKDEKGRANMVDELSVLCKCEVYPVHRLDMEVGGVMVYAKNAEAAAKMSVITASHENFKKEYLAVVEGFPKESGTFEDLLYHDKIKNKTYVVKRERKGVKKAKLEYRVVGQITTDEREISLVKVRLYTGRTHQIRVQFASRGFPIVGDRRYGASSGKNIHLFSHKIEFLSPFDKKGMSFSAEPPKENEWAKFI